MMYYFLVRSTEPERYACMVLKKRKFRSGFFDWNKTSMMWMEDQPCGLFAVPVWLTKLRRRDAKKRRKKQNHNGAMSTVTNILR